MKVRVRVKPNARRERFLEVNESQFEVDVKESAEQNLANRRVQQLIADHFNRPVTSVRFLTGARSKSKMFEVV